MFTFRAAHDFSFHFTEVKAIFLDLPPLIYWVCAVVVDVMAEGTDAMMTLLDKDLIRT